jgi:hypothetical protein
MSALPATRALLRGSPRARSRKQSQRKLEIRAAHRRLRGRGAPYRPSRFARPCAQSFAVARPLARDRGVFLRRLIQRFFCAAARSVPETGPPVPRIRCESLSYPSSLSPFPQKNSTYPPVAFCTLFITGRSSQVVHHMLFIMGSNSRLILITMGPTVTTNREGKIQKKIGNTSLTPSLAAFSSAIWRACTRM